MNSESVTVILSGCHAGPNPAPGLGTASSLRAAYPKIKLVAKDHSTHASGMHSNIFDKAWVARPWNELDTDIHLKELRDRLKGKNIFYLPGTDLEARWLAENKVANVLVPPREAFRVTTKPCTEAARMLPVSIPVYIALDENPREVYRFAVRHGWSVWAKGPFMDAIPIYNNLPQLQAVHAYLKENWGDQQFFLQQHIRGRDVTIAFAAYNGKLLDAVYMEKMLVTYEGKCWAAEVLSCAPDMYDAINDVVRKLQWTGGGELEFVKDDDGILWLIDWNSRFPAWIHGATIAGRNLPGLLIAAAAGIEPPYTQYVSRQFTRIVTEIPVQEAIPLPPPPAASSSSARLASHPSGLTEFMHRLTHSKSPAAAAFFVSAHRPVTVGGPVMPSPLVTTYRPVTVDDAVAQSLKTKITTELLTPARILLQEVAEASLQRLRKAVSDSGNLLRPAYSVKTHPDSRLLHLALKSGMLVEVISLQEALFAQQQGFRFEDIVYNGPIPLDMKLLGGRRLHAVFADSIEAFRRLCESQEACARTIGIRIAAFGTLSRFGLNLADLKQFTAISEVLSDHMPDDVAFGFSFHFQSSVCGSGNWMKLIDTALAFAEALQRLSGRPVLAFDIGGGWISEEFPLFLTDRLPSLLLKIRKLFPDIEEVLLEPGKALVENSMMLVTRVLEVRERANKREVIVDGSIAELPLTQFIGREVYAFSANEKPVGLQRGNDRILGRLCMEHDILAVNTAIPAWLKTGDFIVFSHAGAYDASMSYIFGLGG